VVDCCATISQVKRDDKPKEFLKGKNFTGKCLRGLDLDNGMGFV
jgi:hypothetical protein